MKNVTKSLLVLATTLLLTGCIGLSFTEKKYETNRHISIGQELIDLRTAYDENLINDEEYEAARQEILKRREPEATDGPVNKENKGE